jgi:hypothetical protein
MANRLFNPAVDGLRPVFIDRNDSARRFWTGWHVGAGLGLLGGTLVLFGAAFLTIFQFIYGEIPHGNWLFAVVAPLWILGAHCFDKVEQSDKARRIEYCRRTGLNDSIVDRFSGAG